MPQNHKSPKLATVVSRAIGVLSVLFQLLALERQSAAQERVNEGSRIQAEFLKRVQEYVKLRNSLEAAMPPLKPTASAEKIRRHERELAEKIRKARRSAVQGEIFTPPIAEEFKRLIGLAMQGQDKTRVETSLKRSEPVQIRLRVNQPYPPHVPLQTTPPSILLNLPPLPKEVDYRVLGRDLVLRDVKANLIIDVLPNALP